MRHIVLLHGAIGSAQQLCLLAEALADKYCVHTLNFSGHGGEPIPKEDFSIPLFAKDVIRWMDKNSIQSICIFGYSMGGYVALYLAKNYPSRIEKVFTLATKFNWTPEIAQQEIKMLDSNRIAEKVPAFADLLKNRHQPQDWKVVLNKTAQLMVTLGNKNELLAEDYSCIKIPVTISIGEKDKMVTMEETIAVANQITNASLLVFPDTPHPMESVNIKQLSLHLSSFF